MEEEELLSNMNYYCFIISLCVIPFGFNAEECNKTLFAWPETFYAPEGGCLSLSCVVQHCRVPWTGAWMRLKSSDELPRVLNDSSGHSQSVVTESDDRSGLRLTFLRVEKSDEGFYGCRVTWDGGESDQGHLMFLNVTAAVLQQRRNPMHRLLVYASACLFLPVILGFAHCLCSAARLQPRPRKRFKSAVLPAAAYRAQPHPVLHPPLRCSVLPKCVSSHKGSAALLEPQQKTEVVYADISQDALSLQTASREPENATIYTSVRFS